MDKKLKRRFEDLKQRVERRKKNMPSVKADEDTSIENQNATELAPYVCKLIGEVE